MNGGSRAEFEVQERVQECVGWSNEAPGSYESSEKLRGEVQRAREESARGSAEAEGGRTDEKSSEEDTRARPCDCLAHEAHESIERLPSRG